MITISGFLAMGIGLAIMIGPGDALHHQLHKWDIKPYFVRCCCANADHTECAWTDHSGHRWAAHHRLSRAGFLLATCSAALAGLGWERLGTQFKRDQ